MRPDYHPEARSEILREALRYREIDRDLGLAFKRAVRQAEGQIVEAPHRWAPYLHDTKRYLLPRPWPFGMVYLPEQPPVVIAFAHTSRSPGYWTERL